MSTSPDGRPVPSENTAVFTGPSADATGAPKGGDTALRAARDPAAAMPETLSPQPAPPTEGATLAPEGAPELPPAPRTFVKGYENLGELGRGGMGVVYKARQTKLNRLVALKMVLAGDYASPEACVRFLSEAETVAGLHHPNIIQVYEFGSHEGFPYFTLEYLEGGALDKRLKGVPWPASEAARCGETLARAVHHAHRHGIVHRDLKPANVLLDEDNTLKITDFGLAKRLDCGSGLTQSGSIMGTPSYMAPEQAQGDNRHVGPLADVYALGAVLYELLTGRPPFQAETPVDTIMHLLDDEPVPPSRLNPRCPRDLETIVLKCLQKPMARRYATAEDLADDLKRFQDGEPIHARPTPRRERVVRWVKKRPAVAALLAVCVLAGAAFLAYGWWYNLHLKQMLVVVEEQKRAAEEQKQIAEEQTRVAEAEKSKVEQNLGKRADIIDLFLDHVDGRLANLSGADSVRLEFLTEVEKLSQQLLSDSPTDPKVRRQAGLVYRGLGELQGQRGGGGGRGDDAFRKAADLQEKLVADFPDDVTHKMDLTLTKSRQATQHTRARRFDAALTAYERAIALQDELRQRFPDKEDHLMRCAYYRWLKGNVLEEMDQLDEALALYRQSAADYEALVAKFPTNPSHFKELASVALSLGYAREPGDAAAARPWFQRAVSASRAGHQLGGGRGRDLQMAYGDLYEFYKRHQHHAELHKIALERRRDIPGDGGETYNSACYVCDAVRAVAESPELSAAQRQALTDTYAKAAIDLIHKSLEEGYTDRARMANDVDLDVLRDRGDFKEFWAQTDKRFPNKLVTPAKRFEDYQNFYDSGLSAFQRLTAAARTAAEKKRAKLHKPHFARDAGRVLDLAEKNPQETSSMEALAWVLERAAQLDPRSTTTEERQAARPLQLRAMQLLERDHLTKKSFDRVCRVLGRARSAPGDLLLKAAAEKSPEIEVRALSAYYLADSLAKQALAALEQGSPNGEELSRKAEKQFQEVLTQYGSVSFGDKALAEYIQKPLDELRLLSPGRAARPIEGTDLDGKAMNLGDHKGKVVLIDFWADWCGFCRQAHPMQLALAERMKNRPFVIFGVNADDDREAAKRGVARAKLTWRSLWDADGKVRDAWQVDGFPRFYLLDHTGIIRKKVEGLPDPGEIDDAVEKLVKEAEKALKP